MAVELALYLLVIMLSGCASSEPAPTHLPFCEMHTTDQSYVNNDKSDMVKYQSDRDKRLALIEENFDLLMRYSRVNGFPYVETNMAMGDSCKYWAVTMTMLHTAQTRPELFFSEEMSTFFNEEMSKGNIQQELLEKCVALTNMTTSPTEKVKQKINEASQLWGVNY